MLGVRSRVFSAWERHGDESDHFERHGGPEVLRYTQVAEPEMRAGEVLVRVHACALNHLDLWVRGGIPGVPFPLPHIPGSDVAE